MRRRRAFFAILIVAFLCSCTRTISSGDYGPFRIGESKLDALRKLHARDRTIEPQPYPKIHLENPSRADLEKVSGQAGVLVWLDHEPVPLRIEFSNGAIVRTWPDFDAATYRGSNADRLLSLASLQDALPPGTSERVALDAISAASADRSVTVGLFVVGYQKFRTGEKSDVDSFDALLLANDSWRFDGLKEELWFDPFYSRVTLYFEADALSRIEHWWYLVETP